MSRGFFFTHEDVSSFPVHSFPALEASVYRGGLLVYLPALLPPARFFLLSSPTKRVPGGDGGHRTRVHVHELVHHSRRDPGAPLGADPDHGKPAPVRVHGGGGRGARRGECAAPRVMIYIRSMLQVYLKYVLYAPLVHSCQYIIYRMYVFCLFVYIAC